MKIYVLIIYALIISLPILYLLYLKFFSKSTPTTTSTTLKDREGFVIKDIRPENIKGKVRIIQSSKVWSATADEKIEAGTKVKIIEVEGVHLIVENIEKEVEELSERDKESLEHTEHGGPFYGFSEMTDSIRERWSSTASFFKNKIGKDQKSSKQDNIAVLEEQEEELKEEKGFDIINIGENITLGTLMLFLGLLIIISVSILKFVGPGELPLIGEYPLREINPNDHLSIHFFTGIVIGIIVTIIGGTMSIINQKESSEELEELEEEIKEEDICTTCGTVILIDVEECPECGDELKTEEEL